jgi:pilus assembly protein Flp/PilA
LAGPPVTGELAKICSIIASQSGENLRFSASNNLRLLPVGSRDWNWDERFWWSVTSEAETMRAKLSTFLKDESGATAIEYGLIAAGISVAIITVVNSLGTKLSTTFDSVSTSLK